MKRFASIKTRITIWYTSLVFVIVAFVLIVVGVLSYQISIDNVEKDVTMQVNRVAEKLRERHHDVFYKVDSDIEFKNVSIYGEDGEYIAGQYIYDVANIRFKQGVARMEKVDGKNYIVYDVFMPIKPGARGGLWIRGVESVNSTTLLGRSAFTVILIITPFILLIVALGGYYITKKAFLPINNIVKTANNICTKNDVKQRITISPDAPEDELHNLSVTLNTMLDKIEFLISQEKQFTSDASHELRTPISVILAQGEYLLDIADSEKEKELAKNIVDKANQVSKLVSRLLLISRIDSNRQKINKEKVNLSALVDISIDSVCDIIEQKNIKVTTDVDENIIVNADEALLLSAIGNLVSNGIKYGKEGGSLNITGLKTEEFVKIKISDDGIGISPENLEHIWERFYRVDDVRNDEYSSNGLGLSMVKAIIELHGGCVSVKSVEGSGTEFEIKLDA